MVGEATAQARAILGTRPEGVTVATYEMMLGVVAGYMAVDKLRGTQIRAVTDRMGAVERQIKPRVRVPAAVA